MGKSISLSGKAGVCQFTAHDKTYPYFFFRMSITSKAHLFN